MATKLAVEIELLQRLERLADSDPKFTPSETEIIKKMANAYIGLMAWGKLFKFIIYFLTALAGAILAWKTIVGTFK